MNSLVQLSNQRPVGRRTNLFVLYFSLFISWRLHPSYPIDIESTERCTSEGKCFFIAGIDLPFSFLSEVWAANFSVKLWQWSQRLPNNSFKLSVVLPHCCCPVELPCFITDPPKLFVSSVQSSSSVSLSHRRSICHLLLSVPTQLPYKALGMSSGLVSDFDVVSLNSSPLKTQFS